VGEWERGRCIKQAFSRAKGSNHYFKDIRQGALQVRVHCVDTASDTITQFEDHRAIMSGHSSSLSHHLLFKSGLSD